MEVSVDVLSIVAEGSTVIALSFQIPSSDMFEKSRCVGNKALEYRLIVRGEDTD